MAWQCDTLTLRGMSRNRIWFIHGSLSLLLVVRSLRDGAQWEGGAKSNRNAAEALRSPVRRLAMCATHGSGKLGVTDKNSIEPK